MAKLGHLNGHDLVSPDIAAQKLGVTDRTVRRWAAKGRIKAVRRKGKWLIDVTNYMIERAVHEHLAQTLTGHVAPAADPADVQGLLAFNRFPAAPIASEPLRPNDAAMAMVIQNLKGFMNRE
jgi:excisionase family DNA binding protein